MAFLSRFLPKLIVEGKVFMVPEIDVDQTHSGSLEGIPTIMCGSLHQGVILLSRSSTYLFHLSPAPSRLVVAMLDFITN